MSRSTLRTLLIAAGALGALGAIYVGIQAATGGALTPAALRDLARALGPWGPPALIAALAILLVFPVFPASALQVGAGLAFGPLGGFACTMLADAIGAALGYTLARGAGGVWLAARLSAEQRATLDRLSARITWRSIVLLRLLPGPAYPLVSFAAGYARVPFATYMIASLAGVAPSLALLAFAGDLVLSQPLVALAIAVAFAAALAVAGRVVRP